MAAADPADAQAGKAAASGGAGGAAVAAKLDEDLYQDPHAISADQFEDTGPTADAAEQEAWNQPGLVEDLSSELEDLPSGLDAANPDSVSSSEISETTETFDALGSSRSDAPSVSAPSARDDLSEIQVPRRPLRARLAVPLGLVEQGVSCEVEGGGKTLLPYERIDAMAAGAVRGLSEKPVIVIDLVLNWMALPDEPLKVVRFRSDGFDPRRIVPDRSSALESLRVMLDTILRETGATPLPDAEAARGAPFASFESLERYNDRVLMVEPD